MSYTQKNVKAPSRVNFIFIFRIIHNKQQKKFYVQSQIAVQQPTNQEQQDNVMA